MDESFVDPTREQFEAFKALPRDVPIHMINLLRFRGKAEYPEDHALHGTDMTGEEAYARYGEESGPIFRRVGGEIVWRGTMEAMVIGPDDKQWDAMFIARYPAASCFLEMVTDPEYRKAVINRQAAVLTSRLIRCGEIASHNGTFG